MVRLFVAVDLSDEVKEAIALEQKRLAAMFVTSRDSLRLVKATQLHVTLLFLGEVAEAQVAAAIGAMDVALELTAFELAFGGSGVFPPRGAPRVLWIGVTVGAASLVRLHSAIVERIRPLEIVFDDRPFPPLDDRAVAWVWRRSPSSRSIGSADLTSRGRRDRARVGDAHDAISKPSLLERARVHSAGACYALGDTMTVVILIAYLIGSIPFALLMARRWSVADLRLVGSGNLGAANVMRASGVTAGVLVALLDMAKGAASVWIAAHFATNGAAPAAAGFAAIVGHVYPVWLRFRGGKGVATTCGVFSVLTPLAVPPALAIFLGTVLITKYISLGSVLASLALPPLVYATGSNGPTVASAAAAAALIIFRHRSNMARLRDRTERRVGARA